MKFDHNKTFAGTRQSADERQQEHQQQAEYGIREYILSVYQYMALALIITAVTAAVVTSSATFINFILHSPLQWILVLAPITIVLSISGTITKMSLLAAHTALIIFAILIGLALASIFLIYTEHNMIRACLTIAATFAVMSMYGYQTERDLGKISSFLLMGVIGLIIAGLVGLFLPSSKLQFMMSAIAVIVFTILTAYDTQRIRNIYDQASGNENLANKLAIYGALLLYTDLINVFMRWLQQLSKRRY